jgi:hypothetical protein
LIASRGNIAKTNSAIMAIENEVVILYKGLAEYGLAIGVSNGECSNQWIATINFF